jgi:hypothetical protein
VGEGSGPTGLYCISSLFPLCRLLLYVGWGLGWLRVCSQHQGCIHFRSFPYRDLLLASVNFVACGPGRFLLTPKAPQFVHPRVENIQAEGCPMSCCRVEEANRALSSTLEGEGPREPCTLLTNLSAFRHHLAVNHPAGRRSLQKLGHLPDMGSELLVPPDREAVLQAEQVLVIGSELPACTAIHRW